MKWNHSSFFIRLCTAIKIQVNYDWNKREAIWEKKHSFLSIFGVKLNSVILIEKIWEGNGVFKDWWNSRVWNPSKLSIGIPKCTKQAWHETEQ